VKVVYHKKNWMKKCKMCGDKFLPRFSTLQATCEKPACIIAWSKKSQAKEHRQWKKQAKARTMTTSDHIQICQRVFNTFIRIRDKDLPCISCGTKANVQYAAGHFFSVGSYPNLRFNEDNVHKQCNRKCNMALSGNLLAYREGLIDRIGIDRFNQLDALKNVPVHYTITEVKDLIALYKLKINELKIK
jgi:hypothetical protein